MPLFRDEAQLRAMMAEAGLGGQVEAVVATALPALAMLRQRVPDGPEHLLASRLGGLPALPPGVAWPVRGPLPDAAERGRLMDEALELQEQVWRNPPLFFLPDGAGAEGDAAVDQKEAQSRMVEDVVAGMRAVHAIKRPALFRPMPLGFVGQINLAQMAAAGPLPPEFPDHGLLSVFYDTSTWRGAVRVFHHAETERLERRDVPEALIRFWDATETGRPWAGMTDCAVLSGSPCVSIPEHWALPSRGNALAEWIESLWGYDPFRAEGAGEDFGEQFGGWADGLQTLPELEIDPGLYERSWQPGRSGWRHVMTFSAEGFATDRYLVSAGDAELYLMVPEEDLAEWRFDRAVIVDQAT